MSSSTPVIFVDDREPPRIAEQLQAYGCSVSIGHFESGDYIIYPHGLSVGIERKTISNIAAAGMPSAVAQRLDALKKGDQIVYAVLGAGLAWGGGYMEVL